MMTTTQINNLVTKCKRIGFYAFARWAAKQNIRIETTLAVVRLANRKGA